jgi:CubicO group peptidase (beta-lactamase class C family)
VIRKDLSEVANASIAVAVARDGKIIWEEGFGWSDAKRRRKATPHTMYSLASISKPITATGLMVLVQRGAVDLDAPVNDYLGEAKLRGREDDDPKLATVRRVANHTAGLPLHYQFYYDNASYRPPSRDETIERYGYFVTKPGERFNYSNLGYGVLDYVVERVSGKPYAEFMRAQVFDPLGMTHTSVGLPKKLQRHAAIRYRPDGKPYPFYEFDHDGASAVWSSAHDLVRFGAFHLGGPLNGQAKILDKSSRESMTAVQEPGEDYALGWGISRRQGLTVIAHTGGMPGVMTSLRMYPEEDVATVVLINSRAMPNMHRRVSNEILRALQLSSRADQLCGLEDDHAVFGRWQGTLTTAKGTRPLAILIESNGEVVVEVDGVSQALANPKFDDSTLTGTLRLAPGAEQSDGERELIRVELKLRESGLDGSLVPQTHRGARSSFVQLKRSAGD